MEVRFIHSNKHFLETFFVFFSLFHICLFLRKTGLLNPIEKNWGIGQIQSVIKNKATINFQNSGKKVINLENVTLEKIQYDK